MGVDGWGLPRMCYNQIIFLRFTWVDCGGEVTFKTLQNEMIPVITQANAK